MGYSSTFNGLRERMGHELQSLLAAEGNRSAERVRVSARRNRQWSSWMGGALLAEDDEAGLLGVSVEWVDRQRVEEEGYERIYAHED